MSAGMRSGVNWMRWKLRWKIRAMDLTSSVLASPGAPVIRQWPPANSAMRICSMTSCWPTITLRQFGLDLRAAGDQALDRFAFGSARQFGAGFRGVGVRWQVFIQWVMT